MLKLCFLKYTVTAYFVVFFRYCRCVSIQSIFHRNSHMISLHAKQIKSQVTMGQKISSVYYARLLYGFNVLLANIMYVYSASTDSRALFSCNAHRLIIGLPKQSKKPCNKQLINLEHSVFTGKYQTLALMCWPHYCSVYMAMYWFEIFLLRPHSWFISSCYYMYACQVQYYMYSRSMHLICDTPKRDMIHVHVKAVYYNITFYVQL